MGCDEAEWGYCGNGDGGVVGGVEREGGVSVWLFEDCMYMVNKDKTTITTQDYAAGRVTDAVTPTYIAVAVTVTILITHSLRLRSEV